MTAAYQLAQSERAEVVVFEASAQVGGLSRSFDLWGHQVDLGPHRFFSNDRRVNALWLKVAGRNYRMVDRLTRIHYQGKFFHYPLKPVSALLSLGPLEAIRCLVSYGMSKLRPVPRLAQETFAGWVTHRFGKRLFEIFFKSYSEKLWGILCTELDSDFASQRIKKLSFLEVLKNTFAFKGGHSHVSLIDRFAYPNGGTGRIYERMAEEVAQRGGAIHLNSKIKSVALTHGKVTGVVLEDGSLVACDSVVSTMPLTQMCATLPGTPEEVIAATQLLRFRNTILVYLHIDGRELFSDNWLYIHSPGLRMGRVTNFNNWGQPATARPPSTVLCLEYWCNPEDAIWQHPDEALIALATREIQATGLIGQMRVLEGKILRIPKSYPIYHAGYRAPLKTITDYLRQIPGLVPIGRYGSFKYNNQDHSILMGMLAAENLLQEAGHDLWAVNTDYESYQEQALITEVGLVETTLKAA